MEFVLDFFLSFLRLNLFIDQPVSFYTYITLSHNWEEIFHTDWVNNKVASVINQKFQNKLERIEANQVEIYLFLYSSLHSAKLSN